MFDFEQSSGQRGHNDEPYAETIKAVHQRIDAERKRRREEAPVEDEARNRDTVDDALAEVTRATKQHAGAQEEDRGDPYLATDEDKRKDVQKWLAMNSAGGWEYYSVSSRQEEEKDFFYRDPEGKFEWREVRFDQSSTSLPWTAIFRRPKK